MTNTWQDIKNANVVVVMGGNAAEAHPCGFKWVIEAKIENHAKLVVVDPRFTRTASVADVYAPIRPGTDIAFLSGVIRYLLEKDADPARVRARLHQRQPDREGRLRLRGRAVHRLQGRHAQLRQVELGLRTRRAGLRQDRRHAGSTRAASSTCCASMSTATRRRWCRASAARRRTNICRSASCSPRTAAPDKALTSLFALGWTQHSVGAQNIRTMAMVQLLLGNIGVAGGGMNALRGHSNIQGLTDVGLLSNQMPGYLTLPSDQRDDLRRLHEDAAVQAAAAGADQLLAELPEVLRQLPEGDLRRRRDAPTTTGPTTGCRSSTSRSTTSSAPSR